MNSSPVRNELAALLALAAPLFATQLGTMLLGVVDTAVVGRLGEAPLAAVGLGHVVFYAVGVVGFGWMLALDPLIAQAIGANEPRRARELFWQGAYVALIGALPLSLVLAFTAQALSVFGGLEENVASEVRAYLYARIPGMLPFLWLAAARSFLQSHAITRPLVVGVIVANLVNLPLTYLLVFGDTGLRELGLPAFGVPAMRAAGAGWATTAATLVQLGIGLVAVRALWGDHGSSLWRPNGALMLKTLRLGTPIGLTLLAEVGSFAIVSVLMGRLGTRALAAHNVAITLISTSFQAALALGAAASVRVGQAIGQNDAAATRRAGFTALVSIGAVMSVASIAFLVIPRWLAAIITDERAVIEAAVPLFLVAAAFQLSDGVQAVAAGTLRGAGDTRVPLLANLVGHYVIGVPLGATLAFGVGMGATGLWWGLSAGLTAVAVTLGLRFWSISKSAIRRV